MALDIWLVHFFLFWPRVFSLIAFTPFISFEKWPPICISVNYRVANKSCQVTLESLASQALQYIIFYFYKEEEAFARKICKQTFQRSVNFANYHLCHLVILWWWKQTSGILRPSSANTQRVFSFFKNVSLFFRLKREFRRLNEWFSSERVRGFAECRTNRCGNR